MCGSGTFGEVKSEEVLDKSYVKFAPVRWPRRDFSKAVSFVFGISRKGAPRKLFGPTRDLSIVVIYGKAGLGRLRHHHGDCGGEGCIRDVGRRSVWLGRLPPEGQAPVRQDAGRQEEALGAGIGFPPH